MSDWTNPCGGTLWRERSSGAIEVQGSGVPMYAAGTQSFSYLETTYDNWRGLFHRSAADHGVPVNWLVAIASVETGPWSGEKRRQERILSPAGAIGVMQIMPSTAELLDYSPNDMSDAAANINAGADLISRLRKTIRSGLPAICGAYNSGRVCCDDPGCRPGCANQYRVCTDGDYPGAAIRYNNAAVEFLDLSPPAGMLKYAGGALLGAALAGGFIFMRERR